MRAAGTLVAVAACLLGPGCCNFARWMCGPDDSDRVSERFDTPTAAIATQREAVRRADTIAITRCLSEDFKQQTGIRGVLETALVWQRLRDEVPGIHLLGYAEVSERRPLGPGRCEYELAIAGQRMVVRLMRQPYWELAWTYDPDDPDDLEPRGEPLTHLGTVLDATIDEDEGTTAVSIRLPPIDVPVELDRIQSASVGFEWKVQWIEAVDPGGC